MRPRLQKGDNVWKRLTKKKVFSPFSDTFLDEAITSLNRLSSSSLPSARQSSPFIAASKGLLCLQSQFFTSNQG
jgi:hypothetical protein